MGEKIFVQVRVPITWTGISHSVSFVSITCVLVVVFSSGSFFSFSCSSQNPICANGLCLCLSISNLYGLKLHVEIPFALGLCLLPSFSFIYLLYSCPQVVHHKQYWELRCGDNIIMNVTEAWFDTDTHLHWAFLEIVFWARFIYLWYTEQYCHMLRIHSIKLWDG